VEGPEGARTLEQVQSHLIVGTNVAYAVHPYNESNYSEWNVRFGDAARAVPVLADEWALETDRTRHCTSGGPGFVPSFFSYLRRRGIGLGAWGLIPGVLVTNTATFTPTRITSGFSCVVDGVRVGGYGQLVENYFRRYARR
jgi:hypothetical protein